METEETAPSVEGPPSGWQTVNSWLTHAIESKNEPLIISLLRLLLKCPVTVDRLKENNTPKLVKGLKKDFAANQDILCLSKELVESWTRIIQGGVNGSVSNNVLPVTSVNKPKKVKGRKGSLESDQDSSSPETHVINGSESSSLCNNNNKETASGEINGKSKESKGSTNNKQTIVLNDSSSFMAALVTPERSSVAVKRKKTSKPLSEAVDSIKKEKKVKKSPEESSSENASSNEQLSSQSISSSATSSSTEVTQGPAKSYPRGCLNYTRGIIKGVKKSVRWMPDDRITAIKTFEVDEQERVNVFRLHQENQRSEGDAFRHRLPEIPLEETSRWPALIPIDIPPSDPTPGAIPFVRGSKSVEKEIQAAYQRESLADVYMTKELGPESPYEPEKVEKPNNFHVKEIPLEDPSLPEGSLGVVTDFSGNSYVDQYANVPVGVPFMSNNSSYSSSMYAIDHRVVSSSFPSASSSFPSASPSFPSASPSFPSASSYSSSVSTSNWSSTGLGQQQSRPSESSRLTNNRGRPICKHFAKKGFCSFNNCKFLHVRDPL